MKQAVAHLVPFIEAERAEREARGEDGGRVAAASSAPARRSAGRIVMATVKGDVHDIGKNIVGVVLGCNDYEVIDLGVMVPWTSILETAVAEEADLIGLSGLITPSLEEMRVVATEMERAGLRVPLLIGGATTSRAHTAVKLEPAYSGPVVHVEDASRAVGRGRRPARSGGSRCLRGGAPGGVRRDAAQHEGAPPRSAASASPRPAAGRLVIDWQAPASQPTRPSFLGVRGRWPTTPSSTSCPASTGRPSSPPGSCAAATRTSWPTRRWAPPLVTSSTMAWRCCSGSPTRGCCGPTRVVGFWPANSTPDDDIVLWADEARSSGAGPPAHAAPAGGAVRRPTRPGPGRPHGAPLGSGVADYVGAFAVTAGHGLAEARARFEAAHDDYSAILLTALADRLAEAFAERLHELVRRELWGYAADEDLDNEALIAATYQGIRPAPGYPACPDHTEKATLFRHAGGRVAGRHPPDRDDGHAAGCVRERPLLLAPAGALLRGRAHRARPSSRTTPAARAGAWPRRSAGWRPTWPSSEGDPRPGCAGAGAPDRVAGASPPDRAIPGRDVLAGRTRQVPRRWGRPRGACWRRHATLRGRRRTLDGRVVPAEDLLQRAAARPQVEHDRRVPGILSPGCLTQVDEGQEGRPHAVDRLPSIGVRGATVDDLELAAVGGVQGLEEPLAGDAEEEPAERVHVAIGDRAGALGRQQPKVRPVAPLVGEQAVEVEAQDILADLQARVPRILMLRARRCPGAASGAPGAAGDTVPA